MCFKGMKTEIKNNSPSRALLHRCTAVVLSVLIGQQVLAVVPQVPSAKELEQLKKVAPIDLVEVYEINTLSNGKQIQKLVGKKLKDDLGFTKLNRGTPVIPGMTDGRKFFVNNNEKAEAPPSAIATQSNSTADVNKALESVIGDLLSGVLGEAAGTTPIGAYITVGRLVYDLVKNNRPVTDVKLDQSVSVMPVDPKNWNQMAGWKGPFYKTYRIDYKNMGGLNTSISMTYQISYFARGSFKGKGQYLADVKVKPTNVYVVWGHNFSAAVETSEVVNMGTEENPIPAIHLQVKYKTSTILQSDSNDIGFVIRGDGQLIEMN